MPELFQPDHLLQCALREPSRWHDWFNQHSQALDIKIDIAGSETVRDLLSHIVFVDLLFAEWLLGESITLAAKIDPARFITDPGGSGYAWNWIFCVNGP